MAKNQTLLAFKILKKKLKSHLKLEFLLWDQLTVINLQTGSASYSRESKLNNIKQMILRKKNCFTLLVPLN